MNSSHNQTIWQTFTINQKARESLKGQEGKLIWFTGLSGAGKSTLANALDIELHKIGKHTYLLDGDNLRQGLNKDLGFSDADRIENVRRVAEVAKLMIDAGLIVIAALISPFREQRAMVENLVGKAHFIEVYVNTPLEICEARDTKGLYKLARQGKITNMTGLSSPFEEPEHAQFVVDSRDSTNIAQFLEDALPKL